MKQPRRARLKSSIGAALAASLYSAMAHAHLEATGLGPVYDGVLHFLGSPEDLLPVIALSLLAGQAGVAAGRRTLLFLPMAWLLGSLAGLANPVIIEISPLWSAASLLVLGGLVLADVRLWPRLLTLIAVVLGAAHGLVNGSGLGWSVMAVIALAGVASAVFCTIALLTALVTQLRAHWTRIAVRVAGSWIAAIGILMAGWSLAI
ncbi:MAG: HupE/UreJ family protein [Halioglobus sp.]